MSPGVLGAVNTVVAFLVIVGAPAGQHHQCTRSQGQFRSVFTCCFRARVSFLFFNFTIGGTEPFISNSLIPWIVILVHYCTQDEPGDLGVFGVRGALPKCVAHFLGAWRNSSVRSPRVTADGVFSFYGLSWPFLGSGWVFRT